MCLNMCPASEIEERRLYPSRFETPPALRSLLRPRWRIDPALAVKRFRRAAAGREIGNEPHLLRPGHVLVNTVAYLADEVFYAELPAALADAALAIELAHFIDDRFRAVRQEMVVQRLVAQPHGVAAYERMARWYIVVLYLLGGSPREKCDLVLLMGQLRGCLSSLLCAYDAARGGGLLRPGDGVLSNEDEYLCYDVLFDL
ncbi:unnamed protein product, partial [Phaeothamnion confervicola]